MDVTKFSEISVRNTFFLYTANALFYAELCMMKKQDNQFVPVGSDSGMSLKMFLSVPRFNPRIIDCEK